MGREGLLRQAGMRETKPEQDEGDALVKEYTLCTNSG